MAQDYDKIFKENFEELIILLARVILKIDDTQFEEIPDDSQYTIEKRPDFLKKVKTKNRRNDYVLQIEIQTSDPSSMVKRMLLYYGFLYKDYAIPVKQYVLYIGKKGEAKMPTIIQHENLDFKFHLINVIDLNHEDFLYSERPEDIVIAVLCDFREKSADNIIETILLRLKLFSKNELELGRYTKQLEILSNLRNLQELTIKKLSNMSFIYDLETDIRYQQGYQKAKEDFEQKLKEAVLKSKKEAEQAKIAIQKAKKEAALKSKKEAEQAKIAIQKAKKEAALKSKKEAEQAKAAIQQAKKEAEQAKIAIQKAKKEAALKSKKKEEQAKAAIQQAKKEAEQVKIAIQKEKEAAELKSKQAKTNVLNLKTDIVRNLLISKVLTKEYIAKAANVTIEFVEKIEQTFDN